MEFALNIEYGGWDRNRVIAFSEKYDYFKRGTLQECRFHVNALILTTTDFVLNTDKIQIVTDSCSIQYRPKALFGNQKGIFYKSKGKSVYLDENEYKKLKTFIDKCIEQKENILKK